MNKNKGVKPRRNVFWITLFYWPTDVVYERVCGMLQNDFVQLPSKHVWRSLPTKWKGHSPFGNTQNKCAETFFSFSPMMWIAEIKVGGIFFAIWKINLISKQTRRKGRLKNNILIVGFRRVVIKEVIYRFTQIYGQYFRLFGGLFPQLEKLWITNRVFVQELEN